MNDWKNAWLSGLTALAVVLSSMPMVGALQLADPVPVTVTATLRDRTLFGVKTSSGSEINGVTLGASAATNAGVISFTKYDDEDQLEDSDPTAMYAPLRSTKAQQKNWHVVDIHVSRGFTLGVTVSGGTFPIAGGKGLPERLYGWFGGFYSRTGSTDAEKLKLAGDVDDNNSKTFDWKLLHNRQGLTLNAPFSGVAPFNYYLDTSGVPAGSYTGTVTFTLSSI